MLGDGSAEEDLLSLLRLLQSMQQMLNPFLSTACIFDPGSVLVAQYDSDTSLLLTRL